MENTANNYILIIAGFLAIIAELLLGVATGFDLLIIGVILITAGGVGLFINSFTAALITTIIISALYVFVGRKFVKQKMSIATKATNTDALIGKTGVVLKKISPQASGQIKVEGEIWRADSKTAIDEGEVVTVQSVSGVTLTVGK